MKKTFLAFVAVMGLLASAHAQSGAAPTKTADKKVVKHAAPTKPVKKTAGKHALPARDPKTGKFIKKADATTKSHAKGHKKGPVRDPKTGRFIKRA